MTPLDKKLANAKRQRARERAQAPDPATIAAGIDLATVAGHNLRALLLRLLDGEPWPGRDCEGLWTKLHAGFALLVEYDGDTVDLAPLGREVAERLRPRPWGSWGSGIYHPTAATSRETPWAICPEPGSSTRIAALLTVDDLAQAKAYRSEPG
jgi:hypothetical protein